ncbi:MAG: hypothetical protein CSA20_07465 [Deltaproteobacteria bacterium]|nr:MAG: hypothetical protein CSA20_07465 [Deltaproteobacteria bacterium]
MEAFLDTLWEYLAAGCIFIANTLFSLLQRLHFLGPVGVIVLLAIATICVIKILTKLISTKRYQALEKNFIHWHNLRMEAIKCQDPEKGKRMARNIDQAELNRAYYDYFFEGFMLNIARKIIPIFFMFAFINEYYRSEKLTTIFGQGYIFAIPRSSGEPLLFGAVFCYFVFLLLGFLLSFIVGRYMSKRRADG